MRRCEFLGVLGGAAATLAVCTTVLNAADEKAFEKALLGHIMWSAFQCSTYAELSDYKSEQERLHLVGLNAGRTFLSLGGYGRVLAEGILLVFTREFGRERILIVLNFGGEPIAASLASDESPGRLLISSAGDREGEPVRGSIKLRAHEGAVVELSLRR
jgi:hypothetical protein